MRITFRLRLQGLHLRTGFDIVIFGRSGRERTLGGCIEGAQEVGALYLYDASMNTYTQDNTQSATLRK